MAATLRNTQTLLTTRLVLVIDTDDPSEYVNPIGDILRVPPSNGMRRAVNAAFAAYPDEDWYGVIGDDNRFRTPGWDARIESESGIVYGDDLFQHERIPTAWFVEGRIVRALGWLGLPMSDHLYLDNAWQALGEHMECLHYLPDVVIEHLHPYAHKAEWDDLYRSRNSVDEYTRDRAGFDTWVRTQLPTDIRRIEACAS